VVTVGECVIYSEKAVQLCCVAKRVYFVGFTLYWTLLQCLHGVSK